MDELITTETAIVYRAIDGKRFFTKTAAVRRSAWVRLFERNEHEAFYDYLAGGEHHQESGHSTKQIDHFRKVVDRYLGIFGKCF